ncbi:hypothetical protein RhiirA4_463974 [Rhizophagus irregularis]|uniref:Uncharacterized protein n=1 Tax=Rhizophagus irregularis TaxID=588596 RepID=A0A2I1GP51_9GLOM|nr:hypothetical protein RhiirA4_463974 [Rhizophagus irregularis]
MAFKMKCLNHILPCGDIMAAHFPALNNQSLLPIRCPVCRTDTDTNQYNARRRVTREILIKQYLDYLVEYDDIIFEDVIMEKYGFKGVRIVRLKLDEKAIVRLLYEKSKLDEKAIVNLTFNWILHGHDEHGIVFVVKLNLLVNAVFGK